MNKVLFSMLLISACASFAMEDPAAPQSINDLTPTQAKEALQKLLSNIEESKQIAPTDGFTVSALQQRAEGKEVIVAPCVVQ